MMPHHTTPHRSIPHHIPSLVPITHQVCWKAWDASIKLLALQCLVEEAGFRVQHGGAEHTHAQHSHAQHSHAKVKQMFRWAIVDVLLDSMLCGAVLEEGREQVLC